MSFFMCFQKNLFRILLYERWNPSCPPQIGLSWWLCNNSGIIFYGTINLPSILVSNFDIVRILHTSSPIHNLEIASASVNSFPDLWLIFKSTNCRKIWYLPFNFLFLIINVNAWWSVCNFIYFPSMRPLKYSSALITARDSFSVVL